MNYEIPREAFKQRLEDRLNFIFVNVLPENRSPVKFENVENIIYGSSFRQTFTAKYPNKNQNIILYSLEKGDRDPEKAAQELSDLGYHFVYYYLGSAEDVVLDKGLN